MFLFHWLKRVYGIYFLFLVILSLIPISTSVKLDNSFQWEGIQLQTSVQNINDEIRVIQTIINVNIQGCIKHCQQRQICQFISYHTLSNMCSLIQQLGESLSDGNVVTAANFVFGLKSAWADYYSSCTVCSESKVCTIADDNEIVCTVNDCTSPPVIADAQWLGNMFTVGSRLLYQCTNNLMITRTAVCQTNGMWPTVDLTCPTSEEFSATLITSSTTEQTTSQTTTTTGQTTITATATGQTTTPATTTGQTTTPTTTTGQTTTPTTSTEQTTTPTTTTEQTTTPTTTTGQTTTPTTTTGQTTAPITTTEQTTTPTTTTEQTTAPITTTEQTTTPTTTTGKTTTHITTPQQTSSTISLGYQEVTLADNSQFKFLVVPQLVTKNRALQRCINNYQGTLVQILTASKLDFLMDFLKSEGYIDQFDIWVDAYRVNEHSPLLTTDGQDVLVDGANWMLENHDQGRKCARLNRNKDFKLDDQHCSEEYAFICEQLY